MTTKKELKPETLFILEHINEYQVIAEAIKEAQEDIYCILTSLQEDLTLEDWWNDQFEAKINRNKNGIWICKKNWKNKSGYAYFGLDNIVLDALVGEEDTAWCYVHLPSQYRGDKNRGIFKKYVKNNAVLKAKTSWEFNHSHYILVHDFGFGKINKNITDIKDFLLNELNDISFVIPIIDKITKS